MTEMLERVARAIATAGMPLSNNDSMRRARAAIEAMRAATDEMIEAGVTADFGKTLGSRTLNCYVAMIDAALAGPPVEIGEK